MSGERRQALRQKSLLRGLVYFGNSPSAINCLVRDVSDTGARLKFGGPITAPDTLELHIPNKNQMLRAKVKWREVDEIGVAFVSETGVAGQPAGDDDLSLRVERLEAEIASLKQMIRRLQRAPGGMTDAA
jgi:hypothetical protein